METAWLNFKTAFYRGTDFVGVSSRAEFWHFMGIGTLLGLVLIIPCVVFQPIFLLWFVAGLGTLLPHIALTIRRLRDAGYNPHCAWLYIVPLGGPIVWYMCAQPSTSFLSKSTPAAKTATTPARKPSTPTQEKQDTEAPQAEAKDNPKIEELRRQLAEAEAEAAEKHQTIRRLEKLEQKITEKKSGVTELTEEIERHEADLADLKRQSNSPSLEKPDWSSWAQGEPAQSEEERQKEARARRMAERKREVDRERRLRNPSRPSSLEKPDWSSWAQGQSEEQHESGEPFECGDCGAEVAADSDFCESCGANFDSDTIECAHCDGEVPNNANFCPSCGAEFES